MPTPISHARLRIADQEARAHRLPGTNRWSTADGIVRSAAGKALGVRQIEGIHRAGAIDRLEDSGIIGVGRQTPVGVDRPGRRGVDRRVPAAARPVEPCLPVSSTASADEPRSRAPDRLEVAGQARQDSPRLRRDQYGKIGRSGQFPHAIDAVPLGDSHDRPGARIVGQTRVQGHRPRAHCRPPRRQNRLRSPGAWLRPPLPTSRADGEPAKPPAGYPFMDQDCENRCEQPWLRMPFPVIPVLDLKSGQAVHAVGGRRAYYQPIQSILHASSDPIALAGALCEVLSLRTLYVADLDAIEGGRPNLEVYRRILKHGPSLWIDSGVRDAASARPLLDLGPSSVTIVAGLETLEGPRELAAIVEEAGADRVVFSLDLFDGRPRMAAPAAWGTG